MSEQNEIPPPSPVFLSTARAPAPRRPARTDGDPPFLASHFHAQAGMINPGGGIIPTGHWIEFKGYTYVVYQGQYANVSGQGPVPMYISAGIIARTADGASWTMTFDGRGGGASYGFYQPGQMWVRGDWLYCVVAKLGFSWVQPWAYLGPGEIAIWRTSTGQTWEKRQVLVSWPAAGTGQNVGGVASWAQWNRGAQTVWRAKGSGPAGETADWLVVTYEAYANVPGAPVSYHAAPQYRSLDNGETWTLVRDMLPQFPNGPGQIFALPRPGVAVDRWVLCPAVYFSDDCGATWTGAYNPYGVFPDGGFTLPSGGCVFVRLGGMTTGPMQWVSCDYAASITGPADVPGGNANSGFSILTFPGGGGEEMIACTNRSGMGIWHSTNGGEHWTDMGNVPVGFSVQYALSRAPNGRILMYVVSGGGASMDLWVCDDAPLGIFTARTVCPNIVPPPPPPNLRVPMAPCPPPFTPVLCDQECPPEPAVVTMARMLGPLALRRQQHSAPRLFVGAETPALRVTPLAVEDIPVGATFMNIPCAPVCPSDPDLATTCHARLGLFELGANCLGTPGPLSALARRLAAAGRRH